MDTKEILFSLSAKDCIGDVTEALEEAINLLTAYCEVKKLSGNSAVGFLKGESDYTVLVDAHIDQVGMIVTNISENGFLTLKNIGSVDVRALPSRRVKIHADKTYIGTFCSTPPHLASGETQFSDIADFPVDSLLGKNAKDRIKVGDIVTFATEPTSLLGTKVTGRSFDDRAGVTALIKIAEKLSTEKLPVNVAFLLSGGEELGLRGAKTAGYNIESDEAIAVDVTFGDGIGVPAEDSKKLGSGAMIGISPVLDRKVSNKLIKIANENNIPNGAEVMGEHTGTNADAFGITKSGIKAATVSIPLRNMHTDVEVVDICDIEAVVNLICKYILSGGVALD